MKAVDAGHVPDPYMARFAEMCVRNGIFKADDPIVRKMIPPSGEMPK
jgi:hypothetical protein